MFILYAHHKQTKDMHKIQGRREGTMVCKFGAQSLITCLDECQLVGLELVVSERVLIYIKVFFVYYHLRCISFIVHCLIPEGQPCQQF